MLRRTLTAALLLGLMGWDATGLAWELHDPCCHPAAASSDNCSTCYLIHTGHTATLSVAPVLFEACEVVGEVTLTPVSRPPQFGHHASAAPRAPPAC